ncbi:MAG: hypothetical protein M1816_004862 [Peltula sp. TS41687]|nr:MAG: hypothetical protein M1816_004862 [Peltula sp. TS41687]
MATAMPGYMPADLTSRTPGFQLPSFFTPDAVFDENYNLFDSSFADANARLESSRDMTELDQSSSFQQRPLPTDALMRSMQDDTFSPFFDLPTNKLLSSPFLGVSDLDGEGQSSSQPSVTNALDQSSSTSSSMWNGFGREKSSRICLGHPLREASFEPSPPLSLDSPSSFAPTCLHQQSIRSPLHHLVVDTKCAPARTQNGQITPPNDSAPNSAEVRDKMDVTVNHPTPRQTPPPESPAQRPTASQKPAPPVKRPRGRPANPRNGTTEANAPKRQKKTAAAKTAKAQDVPAVVVAEEEDPKRSKFLERNRVAASKCRQKKKEWTSNLETRARTLQNERNQLSLMTSSLKEEVLWLKGELLKHSTCNCERIRQYLNREADHLAPPPPPYPQRTSRQSSANVLDGGFDDNLFDDGRSRRSSLVSSRLLSPITTTFESRSRPSTISASSPSSSDRRFSISSSGNMITEEDREGEMVDTEMAL